ncbi:MAG TPA: type II toxin-antitoxin system VapC family toxin [Candidatus Limnocylindria bacterium]|nr:type II toxin-antitoxin system VapC family toxin [Candidatus Limnocylindria bacterium]
MAEPQTVVLDTSVVLKWFLADEQDRTPAIALRDAITSGEVQPLVPSHLALEVAAGLQAAVRRGRLDQNDVQAAIDAVTRFEIPALDVTSALGRVAAIAAQLGVSVYDAAFVATSEIVRAPLVTADEVLRQRAAGAGRDAVSLSDWI